ncbi:hypothetical protein B0T16DRAFT_423850 [Cercophora newfieldiana]|uniref:Putative gamma-glutamylcyclotransferase n=1 Tax=Cercophora newfieldiana TaxID=92897 RepID=A0AA39XTD0_9PEZI|nr:hypothetical protein B0T16DRAFT_423850 [Cercophora newfieldiana]
MSFLDIMDELESMAQFATDRDAEPGELDDTSIQRWQTLFGYSYPEAAEKLEAHRLDVCRNPISQAHWDMVRLEKEAQGYDKEAYEHACQALASDSQARHEQPSARAASAGKAPSSYLLKMEGPLHDLDVIRATGCLSDQDAGRLKLIAGTDDLGLPANFCILDEITKHNLEAWFGAVRSTFARPTFIRYSMAEKALSSFSCHPTLGVDATLPQNRLVSNSSLPSPMQDEYPVWYFFYGTLADPAVLGRQFQRGEDAEPLTYRPASITGGTLTKWGAKYLALVDACGESTVEGSAFLVHTREQEDALRGYETDRYHVVRCKIRMLDDKTLIKGLTFRFSS